MEQRLLLDFCLIFGKVGSEKGKMFCRLFARILDYLVYFTVWVLVVLLVHQWIGLSGQTWFGCLVMGFFIVPVILMLCLEPILLHLFGTTVGKWLFGIFVVYDRGGRIPIEKARCRTIRAVSLWHGDYRLKGIFRFIEMVEDASVGGLMDWDYEADTSLVIKEKKIWKIAVAFLVIIGLCFVLLCSYYRAEVPKYRGNLTKAEFIENYNRVVQFYGENDRFLNEYGVWKEKQPQTVRIYVKGEPYIYPKQMNIIETDGIVTEVSFFVDMYNRESNASSYTDIMQNAVIAFVGASRKFSILDYQKRQEMLEYIQKNAFQDFSFERAGIVVTCDVEMEGYEVYEVLENKFCKVKEKENYYGITFKMKKK